MNKSNDYTNSKGTARVRVAPSSKTRRALVWGGWVAALATISLIFSSLLDFSVFQDRLQRLGEGVQLSKTDTTDSEIISNTAGDYYLILRSLFPDSRTAVVVCRSGLPVANIPRWVENLYDACAVHSSLWSSSVKARWTFPGSVTTSEIVAVVTRPWVPGPVLFYSLVFFLILGSLVLLIHQQIRHRRNVNELLDEMDDMTTQPVYLPRRALERSLSRRLVSMRQKMDSFKKELADIRSEAEVGDLARQVAHDIRSPLAILDFFIRVPSQQSQSRVLAQKALRRLTRIAGRLLEVRRSQSDGDHPTVRVVHVRSVIEDVIAEKRLAYVNYPDMIEWNCLVPCEDAFVSCDSLEFRRVLSNIFENSVEAGATKIHVQLSPEPSASKRVVIRVTDNGRGIAAELGPDDIVKIFEKGFTTKAEGNGLGMYHAKKFVDDAQGSIRYLTAPVPFESGLSLEIGLPCAPAPRWFVSSVELVKNEPIVVIDDDSLQQSFWRNKLKGGTVVGISKAAEFMATRPEGQIYFVDYEFLGETITGLEIIETCDIAEQAILVTSYFDDEKVIAHCEQVGCRLLPKNMIGSLNVRWKPGSVQQVSQTAFLIEDDREISELWKWAAEERGIDLRVFDRAEEFFEFASEHTEIVQPGIPIYLDWVLGDNLEQGEKVAKRIKESGLGPIHVVTGLSEQEVGPSPWIDSIRGKAPPFVQRA